MVQQKQNRFQKKRRYIIITAIALAFSIALYTVVSILINAGVFNSADTGTSITPPEVLEGEAVLNNKGIAFPYIKPADIISVSVKSHKDRFTIMRPASSEEGKYESYFKYYYEDEKGNPIEYYPEILNEEPNTDYTSFYAIENSDGLNAYKLDYLCAAIGALYFEERIEVEEDRAAQLDRYGLSGNDRETVMVEFINADGEKESVTVYIGDQPITGVGYYFMIAGRDYIYTSAASDRLSYLLGDFETFLHSRIVAKGLEEDHLYEPYLTTDYKQWNNKYYSINDPDGPGTPVAAGSEVIIYADVLTPKYKSDGNTYIGDGYDRSGYEPLLVDLKRISERPEFSGLLSFFNGAVIGDFEDDEKSISVVHNTNEAKIGSTYKYYIYNIEAVVTENGDRTDAGYPVGSNNLVKVTYGYDIDGVDGSDEDCHAIIDLSSSLIPSDVKSKIKSSRVGDFVNVSYEVKYTADNASQRNVKYVITDILLITNVAADGTITYPEKVSKDSIVTFAYKYVVDGYEIGREGTSTVSLGSITEGDDLQIKNTILGKEISSDVEIEAFEYKLYCQPLMDFTTYNIRRIEGFVEKEIIVSFRFENASERNPFYGESIYKNTLDNENKYYALDSSACQYATYLLGGVTTATDQISAGLVGTETVAVGLTAANMIKYGLYEGHTVYFELPRGIRVVDSDKDAELDDYRHLSTLGFTLYISNPNSDGTRYVASTMYDIIVKIDSASFDYLDNSFEDFWARGNLAMIDYKLIEKMEIELNTKDSYGKYEFKLDQKEIYIGSADGQHYDEIPESGGTPYNFITVDVNVLSDEISDSAFSRILEERGVSHLKLSTLYDVVKGEAYAIEHDTAGTANFKELLRLMYGINYSGSMTGEELEGKMTDSSKMMSISFYLKDYHYGYVYDFYRVSDRRVVVHIYKCDLSGNAIENTDVETSGFYISSFAAKKLVNAVDDLLNGQPVDINEGVWGD